MIISWPVKYLRYSRTLALSSKFQINYYDFKVISCNISLLPLKVTFIKVLTI